MKATASIRNSVHDEYPKHHSLTFPDIPVIPAVKPAVMEPVKSKSEDNVSVHIYYGVIILLVAFTAYKIGAGKQVKSNNYSIARLETKRQ